MTSCSSFFPARPTDKQTIDYFIRIGKTLSNDVNETSKDGEESIDRGEILAFISTTLDMSEDDLTNCNGKTLLSTARQVIGKKYPDPLTTFGDVETKHIQAAAGN